MNLQVDKTYDVLTGSRIVVRCVDNQIQVVKATPHHESVIDLFPSDELKKQIILRNQELGNMTLYAPGRVRQIALCNCLYAIRELIVAHNRIVAENFKQEQLL